MKKSRPGLVLLLAVCFALAPFGALAGGLVQVPVAPTATEAPVSRTPAPEWTDFESYLISLALVEQTDPRYYEVDRFIYHWETFGNNGCGPASVANALVMAMGLTEPDEVDDLLADLIRMLRDIPYSMECLISMDHLNLLTDPEGERYTGWTALRNRYPGEVSATGQVLTRTEIERRLAGMTRPAMVVGRFSLLDNARELTQLAHDLYTQGERDALLISCFLLSGALGSDTPFYSNLGHYMTVCIHVGSLEENGTIYLVDSFPRAMSREEYNAETFLFGHYPFIFKTEEYPFNSVWQVERLSDLVLRLSLRPEKLQAVQNASSPDRLLTDQADWLELLELYGAGGFVVSVPGQ